MEAQAANLAGAAADGASALPLLTAGLGVESIRPRRPHHGHGARRPHEPTVSSRTARGRLRNPHALRTGAFLGTPARALVAVATWASDFLGSEKQIPRFVVS